MSKIGLAGALVVIAAGVGYLVYDYRKQQKEQAALEVAKAKVADLIKDVPEIIKPSR